VARDYPGERQGLQNVLGLQTWASNPYQASYTQVVQKKGGPAQKGRTDVGELNAKFDEVYGRGGIYHFMSHPMWLDYGPEQFYQQHLQHIALGPGEAKARFAVRHDLTRTSIRAASRCGSGRRGWCDLCRWEAG
jgi:hypothetical protein